MANEESAVQVRTAEQISVGTGIDTDAKMAESERLDAEVMEGVKAAFEPTNKLARQITLGKRFVAACKYRKANTPEWKKTHYSALADTLEKRAAFEMATSEVRLDVSAKIAGFVEAVKVTNPLVTKVSYFRIANLFLPMFKWDVEDLEGSIRKEWLTFVRDIIDANAETGVEGEKPMPVKEIKAAIEAEKDRHEAERLAKDKRTPEQIDAAEAKAADAKLIAKRKAATARIGKVIDDAIVDEAITVSDVIRIVHTVAADNGEPIPFRINPETATVDEIKGFMAVLFRAGKIAEIKTIADMSAQMVESFKATVKMAG